MKQKNAKTLMHTLSRFAGGVVSLFSGVKAEVKRDVKERIDTAVDRLDLVKRDEFDRLKASVQKEPATKKPAPKAKTAKAKPAAKKTATAKKAPAKKPAAKKAPAKKSAPKSGKKA